jgi:hypothetical protein
MSGTGGIATGGQSGGGSGFFDSATGLITAGPWVGNAYTVAGAGSTVSPACTTTGCSPPWGAQPCASGNVAAGNTETFGMLGFSTTSSGTGWPVSGTGVYVNITATPPAQLTELRIQLVAVNCAQNGSGDDCRYCSALPAGGVGLIPFSSFKTKCWSPGGNSVPNGTKIDQVQIQMPSSGSQAMPFNFCIADIKPQ